MTEKSRLTDRLLADSLKSLMMRVPFEKITINDIANQAQVNRTTVYNHFQDKYELLDWIFVQDFLEPCYAYIEDNRMIDAFAVMVRNMEQDKEFFLHAARSNGTLLRTVMARLFHESIQRAVTRMGLHLEDVNSFLTTETVAHYYTFNVLFLIHRWIDTDMEASSEELIKVFSLMFVTTLERFQV